MNTETIDPIDLLSWAAGTGSAPRRLRDQVEALLAGVDLGERPRTMVAYTALHRVRARVTAEVPEAATDETREVLRGPQWHMALDRLPGLAERVAATTARALAAVLPAEADEIIASYDQEQAAMERQIAQDVAAEQRRRAIEAAANAVRDRREAQSAYERGTQMAAGVLVPAVKADTTDQAGVTGLVGRTGYTRPTLYKYAKEAAAPAGRDLRKATNEQLAEMHLGYIPGQHEDVDAEFWGRYPDLAGWYRAANWLYLQRYETETAEQGGFDPMNPDGPAPLPAYQQLMRQYHDMVQQIATGLS